MKKLKIDLRFGTLVLIVLLAAFSRLIPHPPNFTAVGAMALFGAAYFTKRYVAFIIPVVSLWLSDLVLNNIVYGAYFDHFVWFYPGFFWNYFGFMLIVLLGFALFKKVKIQSVLIGSVSASILFFIVSNFGVWMSGTMYPKDLTGLMACYTAALPFLKNTLAGDLVYCSMLFGAFELAQIKIPALKPAWHG